MCLMGAYRKLYFRKKFIECLLIHAVDIGTCIHSNHYMVFVGSFGVAGCEEFKMFFPGPCDFVTNIFDQEIILDIPNHVVYYNSMNYWLLRYHLDFPYHSSLTSKLREVLLKHFKNIPNFYTVINGKWKIFL